MLLSVFTQIADAFVLDLFMRPLGEARSSVDGIRSDLELIRALARTFARVAPSAQPLRTASFPTIKS